MGEAVDSDFKLIFSRLLDFYKFKCKNEAWEVAEDQSFTHRHLRSCFFSQLSERKQTTLIFNQKNFKLSLKKKFRPQLPPQIVRQPRKFERHDQHDIRG